MASSFSFPSAPSDEGTAAQYLDDYLDFVNHTPDEIARHITILHEIAAKLEDIYRDLDQYWETLQNRELDPATRKRTLLLAQNAHIQAQELGDSKLQQWQCITDIIDNKARALEGDKKRLDFGRENDIHSENHKTEPQPERTSKRSRRNRNIDMTLREESAHEKPEKEVPTPSTCKKQKKKKRKAKAAEKEQVASPFEPPIDPDEPTYCLCDQVSFGEMICCDNESCPREWFHFSCVGLTFKPKGKWYCPKCRGERSNQMKPQPF